MTDAMTTRKPRKKKDPYPFPVELIDRLLAQVQNKDTESILRKSGLAGQLKKMLAERMLAAELPHHLACEDEASKNHRTALCRRRCWRRALSCNSIFHVIASPVSSPSWWPSTSDACQASMTA